MFILSKQLPPKTANLIVDRKNKSAGEKIRGTQRTRDGRLISKSGIGKVIEAYGVRGNIWSYATGLYGSTTDKFAFKHPAILPEKVVEDHIRTWSNPGDLVYDCFGGSGTTGKIAKILGREYIMSELVGNYIPLMKKRVKIKS